MRVKVYGKQITIPKSILPHILRYGAMTLSRHHVLVQNDADAQYLFAELEQAKKEHKAEQDEKFRKEKPWSDWVE